MAGHKAALSPTKCLSKSLSGALAINVALNSHFSLIDQKRQKLTMTTFRQSFEEAHELHPWLSSYYDRSVTELEMLYGALFYPELCKNSSFYLRDPEYLHGIDIIARKSKYHILIKSS